MSSSNSSGVGAISENVFARTVVPWSVFFLRPSNIARLSATGVLSELNKHQLLHTVIKTLNGLSPTTDMIVFRTEPTEPYKEDEGRTLITSIDGLKKKVYARNDARIVTIMLVEEY